MVTFGRGAKGLGRGTEIDRIRADLLLTSSTSNSKTRIVVDSVSV